MSKLSIIADKREPSVISHLATHTLGSQTCQLETLQMTVGDFAIADESRIYAIIERKTIADLSASIKDGRMANKDKLISLRRQSGCDVVFIIEGDWGAVEISQAEKTCGIYTKSLITTVNNLQIAHQFFVHVTRDQRHTATKLIQMAASYAKNKPSRTIIPSVSELLNYQFSRDPTVIVSNMLMTLTGINTSNLHLLYGTTFCALLEKYQNHTPIPDEVNTLPVTTLRALRSWSSDGLFWKAVLQIPGVTEAHVASLSPRFGYHHFNPLTEETEAQMVTAMGQKTSSIPATIALFAGKYKLTAKPT